MQIMVMGAGALGSFYGGLLARAGHDVSFVARGATLDALAQRGLHVRSRLAGDFSVDVVAAEHAGALPAPDVVFFSVKAYDLDSAAEAIAPAVGHQTLIVAVQNGIDHPERLRELLPESEVVPGIVYVSATVPEPGSVIQPGGPGWVHLGSTDESDMDRLTRVKNTFLEAGVESEILEDSSQSLWKKFMHICAMSGVPALTRLTLRQIFDVTETKALYHDVMAEVTAVARASGVDLPESAADEGLTMLLEMDALPERGSMAYDLEAGRRIEIETLNGKVFHLGRELGVSVPMNQAIYASLKPFVDGRVSATN